jgi:hypothetical protein
MNKNLLLVDYQLDNLQNIYNVKNENTDIQIIVDYNNLNNLDNLNYNKIGIIKSNNFTYNVNNSLIECVNENNYFDYLNIDFDYENNYIIKFIDIFIIKLTNFTTFGGIFYLSYIDNLKCFIDNENGTITINPITIGEFIINVYYSIFNLNLNKKVKITILPKINYENNLINIFKDCEFKSIIPTVYPNNLNGIFSINSIEPNDLNFDLIINDITGVFTINNFKENINEKYILKINYKLINLLINEEIELNFLSAINYEKSYFEFFYGENININLQKINNELFLGGLFSVTNEYFLINEITGSISLNDKTNINPDIYDIQINYKVNNYNFKTKIKISIIPQVIYLVDNLFEANNITINKPNVHSDLNINIIFSIKSDLINNIIIDENSGKLELINFESGNYEININLNYNNIDYILKLNIIIYPYLKYENNLNFVYNENDIFNYNNYKTCGILIIKDNISNFDITNLIINKINLEPNNYSLTIYYTKNFVTFEYPLKIFISPNINYKLNDKYTIKTDIYIDEPINSHPSGKYNLNSDDIYNLNSEITIDENNGKITIINPQIKEYIINYQYKINDILFDKTLSFTVYPYVEYKKDLNFIYGEYNIIQKPQILPDNGKFSIDKQSKYNYLIIENNGSILLDKTTLIDSYFIIVNYNVNRIITQIPLNFIVRPFIDFDSDFFYDKRIINIIKPNYFLPANGIFFIKCKDKNIDSLININSNGEILINKNINLDVYDIEVNYQVDSIITKTNININISPDIFYYETNLTINYGSEFIVDSPIINDINGIFYCENEYIIIDENIGSFKIIEDILPGIYNFTIFYKLNNSIKKTIFNINVLPILNYNINDVIYQINMTSEKPLVKPEGGIFTCIYNKDILIDNNTGILTFLNNINVGINSILIKYIYNNVNTEFNYKFNVLPNIVYDDEYNFLNNVKNIIKPQLINPSGGNFILDNLNFVINKNGEININNNLIGTNYVNISYFNIINVQKKIKINITPDFDYLDIQVNYKETIEIQPTKKINALFSFKIINLTNDQSINLTNDQSINLTNDLFNINSNGIITSKNFIIPVDIYNFEINCIIDNINICKKCKLTILPIILSENNNKIIDIIEKHYNPSFIVEPNMGFFKIKATSTIEINNQTGLLIFDDNLNLGKHKITIIYNYNNIETSKDIIINKKPNLIYEKNITLIKGFETNFLPLVNFFGGEFTINNKSDITINNKSGITINNKSGIIKIGKNIDLGYHKYNIQYDVGNMSTNFIFEFNILSPFNYKSSLFDFNYGEKQIIEPNTNTNSSNFYLNENINGITINKESGILYIDKLEVGSYTFNINGLSNDEILTTSIKINILPIIKYNESLINIKYNTSYLSKLPYIYPIDGIFSTESNIIELNENGTFSVNSNIDVNIYYLDIVYEVNNIKSTFTIKLIINPIFEYNNHEFSFDQGTEFYTEMPTYFPKDGNFILINSPKGITIKDNGIIHLQNNLIFGIYDISVLYKLNKINLTNTLNFKILPKFYYDTIDLTLFNKQFINYYKNKNINIECFNEIIIYNKILKLSKPCISNKGYFNIKDSNGKFNINGDDGIITCKNNDIGNYNIYINYNVLNINKVFEYQLLIIPLINYFNTDFYIKFNEGYTSIFPEVYPNGGVFYFTENYEYFSINSETGEISIDKSININKYTIIVFYEINNFISYIDLNYFIYPNTYIDNIETIHNNENILKLNNYIEGIIINNYEIINETIKIENLKIGFHEYNLNANYKDIEFDLNFSIKIISKINYEKEIYTSIIGKSFIISKPEITYFDENGYFDILNKIKGITIDRVSGEIYIFDKLIVNNYIVIVNYILNDIVSTTIINVIITPQLEYNINNIELNYASNFYSDIPYIKPLNGTFTIKSNDNEQITIDNNGIIFISKYLFIDDYILNVIYSVNSIEINYQITVKIKPNIKYNDSYKVEYGINKTIYPLILEPPNYIVKSDVLPKDILLNQNNGEINILEDCKSDIYNIKVYYNINNIETIALITIIVDPFIENSIMIKTNHGQNEIINLHNTLDNILFNINNCDYYDKNKIFIKKNKLILNNLEVDSYKFKINYKINKLESELFYTINVLPEIKYTDNLIFIYNENISISPILCTPINGQFKLQTNNNNSIINKNDNFIINNNDNFIINKNGQINNKINNIPNIGNYEFNIDYIFNKFKTNYNINFKVIPFLSYSQTLYEGYHNKTLIIDSPEYLPKNLNFSITPFGEINNNGKIKINITDIGKYKLTISYDTANIILNILIKPVFFYQENDIIINYGENKILIPTISQNNGKFYIFDNYNGIYIDENNGIIKLDEIIPNIYNLTIHYSYNNINVSTNIKILVNPTIKYNINNLLLKYKSEITTLNPIFSPNGGKFSTDSKILSNNIYLDETTGQLIIDDTNIGNYDIIIKYIYNNQISTTNIVFSVIPVVLYDNTNLIFYHGIENKIDKPFINPSSGKFSIVCNNNILKYINLNTNGSIIINDSIDVGSYDIFIIYEYNKIQFSSKLTININPYIYYENIIIDYNTIFICEPYFTIKNHGINNFSLLDEKLIIDSLGNITNFNNLDIGIHKIYVNYMYQNKEYQTYFLCKILPLININFDQKKIELIPSNGLLNYDNKYIEIDNNNLIYKNIYDDINIPIVYSVNNIEKNIILNFYSKPKKIFDSEINIIYNTQNIIYSYVKDGVIISNDKPYNLKIVGLNLNIEKLNVGIYLFTINYSINNLITEQEIKLLISPKINFINKYFELNSNGGSINERPIIEPINGKFSYKQYIKNIIINNEGKISIYNILPKTYDLMIYYSINDISSFDTITLCCKPLFILPINNFKIKYGEEFIIKDIKVYPLNGEIISNIPFNLNKTELSCNYLQYLNIGTHNINISYSYNNIITTNDITLIIEPTINYIKKDYKTIYGKSINIEPPILSHSFGIFSIIIKSDLDINVNNSDINDENITITSDGQILVSSNVEIGSYTIFVSYFIDSFIISDNINIIVEPYFYYENDSYTFIYDIKKSKNYINPPKFYPNGGAFYIDTNNQNISINKNSGFIEIEESSIGKHNINIIYKYKKNILRFNLTIYINPYIIYNVSVINLKYKTPYIIKSPEKSNNGGVFISRNFPNGIILNYKTGVITINQKEFVDVGLYNLLVSYNINQLTTTANIYLNITL